jgi:hypothetical protein
MDNKLPNLLIVGVAKSGTSSLHQYLAQHPEIFMSKVKEPRFISSQVMDFPMGGPKDDLVEAWYKKDFEDYKHLFSGVANQKVIGESSADTFYFHKKTIPVIQKYFGDPKILVILRNPISRAYSAYQHLLRDDREHLPLKEALLQEQNRIRENYELIYHYKAVGLYSEALQAFFDNFSNVKVVINEELSKNPKESLKEIFKFLEVDSDVTINTDTRYNLSGIPRWRFAHQVLFEGRAFLEPVRRIARLFLSGERRAKISRRLMEGNLQKAFIDEESKKELQAFFRKDIEKTQQILNKDLSHWLK